MDVSGHGLREPAVGWGLGTGSYTIRLAKKTHGGTLTSGPGAEDSTSGASGKPPSGRKHCQHKDQTLEGKREHYTRTVELAGYPLTILTPPGGIMTNHLYLTNSQQPP